MASHVEHYPRYASVALLEKLLSRLTSVSIQVATVDLGIPDRLTDGPKSVDELAEEVGADRDVLFLFLRALSSESIFQEVEPGVFANTEESQYLRSDMPGSLRSIADLLAAEWAGKVWEPGALLHTIRTGEPAFEHAFGENFWEYLAARPDEYATFSKSQTTFSGPIDDAIVDAYDFDGIGTIVDLGGGEGTFISKVLTAAPKTEGVLFDLPSVIEAAREQIARTPVADRCTCVGGTFFEGIPEGADAYVLKNVLHDWSDEESVRILRKCREALAPGGRILVIGHLVPEPPDTPLKYLMASLWVRLNARGYERTEAQFRALFEKVGLELVRVLPTASTHSILETRKTES